MAMDAVKEGETGLMTAIRNGCYTMVRERYVNRILFCAEWCCTLEA
jgi:hypothetical protein